LPKTVARKKEEYPLDLLLGQFMPAVAESDPTNKKYNLAAIVAEKTSSQTIKNPIHSAPPKKIEI